MANIDNVKNIKSLQSWDVPVTIHRTDAYPLDNSSYFTHISAAENYALSGATAHVGQQLFVLNEVSSTVDSYVIQDVNGNLRKLDTNKHTLQKTIVKFSDEIIKTFDWSGKLTQQNINDAKATYGDIVDVQIGNAITSISDYTFEDCSSLRSVSIPNSVLDIGTHVFSNCANLESINIGNGLTAIPYYMCNDCNSLTQLDIPNSVVEISRCAIYNCSNLSRINIPNSVTTIGNDAFSGCSSLTSVTIPDSVTSIGSYAFWGCRGLTSVTIPDSVKSIGEYAFYGCTNLSTEGCVIFEGKQLSDVMAMDNHYWGLQLSNITTWNNATQEWVNNKVYDLTSNGISANTISAYNLSSNNLSSYVLSATNANATNLTSNNSDITNLTVANAYAVNISASAISSTQLRSNKISAYSLSSNNISAQSISANSFDLSIGSIISSYAKQSTISVLNVEDKLTVEETLIVEDESYFGNSTTIHIGESNTLCTLLSSQFTPLSNAISSKIFTGTELCGNYTDLSIIKISKEDYERKVIDAAQSGVDLSNNVLYIISSDYIDAYGQCISNVIMTDNNVPSEATNKHYVDSTISLALKELSNQLTGEIQSVSTDLSNELTTQISNVSTDLTTQISNVSTDLSNAISSKIFTGTVSNGTANGKYSNLSVIKISKDDYENLVTNAMSEGIDLSNDVLYIVSSDYIDAYEKCIKNLVMTDDGIPSEAVNKHYVDNLSFNISGDTTELIRQVSVQLSNQLYSSLSNNCQVVSALSDAISANANVGDVAIVSTYISLSGDKPISRTSYYWNGSDWAAMDGNYDATHIYFSEDLKYTNAIGALPAPTSGQGEISANGLNLKKVLESILVKEKSGTKTNPSVTTTKATSNVLYGTKLIPSYNFTFDDGNYEYGPDPTGSTVSKWSVKTISNLLELPSSALTANSISNSDAVCNPTELCATFSAKALSQSIYQISANAEYTTGDVPYTNIHNPDSQASARIAASSASKQLYLYNVYKPCFWKITTTPTANITSAAISSLSPQAGSNMNVWNVLSNGTWKTSYNCTSPWYEIFFLAPSEIAGHNTWTGKDANNMTVKVEPPVSVEFTHENVGNDSYKLFIVRNADVYGATTVTMTFE